jgi:hypothetical protein
MFNKLLSFPDIPMKDNLAHLFVQAIEEHTYPVKLLGDLSTDSGLKRLSEAIMWTNKPIENALLPILRKLHEGALILYRNAPALLTLSFCVAEFRAPMIEHLLVQVLGAILSTAGLITTLCRSIGDLNDPNNGWVTKDSQSCVAWMIVEVALGDKTLVDNGRFQSSHHCCSC